MEEERKKNNLLMSKEKKCPNCGSINVDRTGGSHIALGIKQRIGFQCYDCGTKFWMSKSDYKP
jgi:transposase-like protein